MYMYVYMYMYMYVYIYIYIYILTIVIVYGVMLSLGLLTWKAGAFDGPSSPILQKTL